MKESSEELGKLISRFADPEQTRQIADEIEQVESRIASFDSPPVRPELTDRIKSQLTWPAQTGGFRIHKVIAAIAAMCLLAISAYFVLNQPGVKDTGTTVPIANAVQSWEDKLLSDSEFAKDMTEQMDQIVNELQEVQTTQWDQPAVWQQDLFELEDLELITSTNFWKG